MTYFLSHLRNLCAKTCLRILLNTPRQELFGIVAKYLFNSHLRCLCNLKHGQSTNTITLESVSWNYPKWSGILPVTLVGWEGIWQANYSGEWCSGLVGCRGQRNGWPRFWHFKHCAWWCHATLFGWKGPNDCGQDRGNHEYCFCLHTRWTCNWENENIPHIRWHTSEHIKPICYADSHSLWFIDKLPSSIIKTCWPLGIFFLHCRWKYLIMILGKFIFHFYFLTICYNLSPK